MGENARALLGRFEWSGLHFSVTDRADDGVLDAFFPAYDNAFILDNEKERIEGFRACLALNHGALHRELAARYGPFREIVAVARRQADGPVVGGANLLVAGLPVGACAGIGHTANLNYVFVAPDQRGRGLAGSIQAACLHVAAMLSRSWGDPSGRGLAFLEVNDPFRLTADQYRQDTAHAGIDQLARLAYWARAHACVLDWAYVQPALSDGQADDETLALAVLEPTAKRLPALALALHLERFFSISVLKGQPLGDSPSAVTQVRRLFQMAQHDEAIQLLSLSDGLHKLERGLNLGEQSRPSSLREALKGANG